MGPPKSWLKKASANRQVVGSSLDDTTGDSGKPILKKTRARTLLLGQTAQGPLPVQPLKAIAPSAAGTSTPLPGKEVAKEQTPKATIPTKSTPSLKKRKVSEGEIHWSEIFTDCEGEVEVDSLWDTRFNVKTFVSKHVLTGADRARVESAGLEQACLALQSMSLKAAAIGNVVGEEFNKLRSQERQARKEMEMLRKTAAEYASLVVEHTKLKEALAQQEKEHKEKEEFVQQQLTDLGEEWKKKIGFVAEQVQDQKRRNAELEVAMEEVKKKLEAANAELADSYLNGFEVAKAQVLCLHPNLDVSEMDFCKTVVNGELVDLPDSEDERTQEHSPKEVAHKEDVTKEADNASK